LMATGIIIVIVVMFSTLPVEVLAIGVFLVGLGYGFYRYAKSFADVSSLSKQSPKSKSHKR